MSTTATDLGPWCNMCGVSTRCSSCADRAAHGPHWHKELDRVTAALALPARVVDLPRLREYSAEVLRELDRCRCTECAARRHRSTASEGMTR